MNDLLSAFVARYNVRPLLVSMALVIAPILILYNQKPAIASTNDGLVVTAEMQIRHPDSSIALVSHTVEVRLQSCNKNPLQLRRFKDGANESVEFSNVAGGCIEIDRSSIPFGKVAAGSTVEASNDFSDGDYRLTGIDAYFDITHKKPSISLDNCVTPPSVVFFNQKNPRESYAHCAPGNSPHSAKGLVLDSAANLYLLLFKYEGRDKIAEVPTVTVIVGLVD